MKVSKLIKHLQDFAELYGDKEILLQDPDTCWLMKTKMPAADWYKNIKGKAFIIAGAGYDKIIQEEDLI